ANHISKQSMDDSASLANTSEFYNLRSWDILHPKHWAHAINAGNVPWQNYECINAEDALIEEVMLGLRIKEGLDISQLCEKMRETNKVFDDSHLQKVLREVCKEDLAVLHENRIIATRKGRLLNDLLIERIVDACEEGMTVLK
ncbi:coproporphyrinogen III oxidase, partial [Bifidobacteriaceae bacterium WP022]